MLSTTTTTMGWRYWLETAFAALPCRPRLAANGRFHLVSNCCRLSLLLAKLHTHLERGGKKKGGFPLCVYTAAVVCDRLLNVSLSGGKFTPYSLTTLSRMRARVGIFTLSSESNSLFVNNIGGGGGEHERCGVCWALS